MIDEAAEELLIQAVAAYDGVVGDPTRFGPVAQEIVDRARAVGDVESLVVSLRALAWFERSRLANRPARRLLDEAAQLARRAGFDQRLGEVLVTRSAVRHELGDTAGALGDLENAGALVDRTGEPDLEMKRAALLHNIGRLSAATAAYRRILEHDRSSADNRSGAANNLALIESLRGRPKESFHFLDLAAEIAPAVGPARIAVIAHNRGLVLAQTGRLAESLRQFDEAIELLTKAELPLGEFHVEHAEALAELRLLPEARELSRVAAEELEQHDVPLMAAEARLKVAQIALLVGDHAAAIESAGRAADQFRRHRRGAWVARAAVVVAQAHLRAGAVDAAVLDRARRAAAVLGGHGVQAGAVDAAVTCGRLAAELGMPVVARRWLRSAHRRARHGPMLVRLKGELAAALAARLEGREQVVLAHCRAGLTDLARHRAALASAELRALASGHGLELGQLGLDVLLRRSSPGRILEWMERTRAAALLSVQPPAPDAVRNERATLAMLYAEIAEARRERGEDPAPLVAKQMALEDRIRRATWQQSGSAGASPAVSLSEIRARLGTRVLVAYGEYADGLFAIVLDRRRSRLVRLGPSSEVSFERDALLFSLRRLTRPGPPASIDSARRSAAHALARLRSVLVAPLGVGADEPVVVVPTADLNRVPWSALYPGIVTVAPSASLWARSVERASARPDGDVVLVGGPGLPGAAHEVDVVAGLYRHPVVLDPPAATMAAVVDALGAADLAHLACHGRLRADNPVFSALQLADGQLTVHELDLRGIAPRRIVLAACDSAADVSYAGDELLGFVSALLGRGTAGMVASVIAVGDVEVVELMAGLHRHVRGGASLAEALHRARAGLDLSDPRQFVNWCAFTAYGAG